MLCVSTRKKTPSYSRTTNRDLIKERLLQYGGAHYLYDTEKELWILVNLNLKTAL